MAHTAACDRCSDDGSMNTSCPNECLQYSTQRQSLRDAFKQLNGLPLSEHRLLRHRQNSTLHKKGMKHSPCERPACLEDGNWNAFPVSSVRFFFSFIFVLRAYFLVILRSLYISTFSFRFFLTPAQVSKPDANFWLTSLTSFSLRSLSLSLSY